MKQSPVAANWCSPQIGPALARMPLPLPLSGCVVHAPFPSAQMSVHQRFRIGIQFNLKTAVGTTKHTKHTKGKQLGANSWFT